MATAGIVVCGGHSRRMGSDKAWLPVDGDACLIHVVRALASLDRVVVVKRAVQELPPVPSHVRVVLDSVVDQGPMRGLLDGMRSLPAEVDAVFLTGCDTPFLSPALIACLLESLGSAEAALPFVEGRLHPLCAAYRPSIASRAERLLAAGRFKLGFLLDACDVVQIDELELRKHDPDLRSFINLNTPEEYRAFSWCRVC